MGEDEYFVMGDNRNDSMDSRDPSVGVLHKNELVGRAWVRIWPLSKFGILKMCIRDRCKGSFKGSEACTSGSRRQLQSRKTVYQGCRSESCGYRLSLIHI